VNFKSEIGENHNKREGSSERGGMDESFEKQEGNNKDGRRGVLFGLIPDQSKVIEKMESHVLTLVAVQLEDMWLNTEKRKAE
jgi:hypothetical protein